MEIIKKEKINLLFKLTRWSIQGFNAAVFYFVKLKENTQIFFLNSVDRLKNFYKFVVPIYIVLIFLSLFLSSRVVFLMLLCLPLVKSFQEYRVIYNILLEIEYILSRDKRKIEYGNADYVFLDNFISNEETRREIRNLLNSAEECVIGEIENEKIKLFPSPGKVIISKKKLRRFFFGKPRISLVILKKFNYIVSLRKSFGFDNYRFLRELLSFLKLKEVAGVPALLKFDLSSNILYKAFIPGKSLGEERLGQVYRDNDSFNKSCFDILQGAHMAGVCLGDLHYCNIVRSENKKLPFFIDFSGSFHFSNKDLFSVPFIYKRSRDIAKFNKMFGTSHTTIDSIKSITSHYSRCKDFKLYSPLDFGYGFSGGRAWNSEVGLGKWNYIIKRNCPWLENARILDLGCNNGVVSMQFARNGAREVVGVENSSLFLEQAEFVKKAFEWLDMKEYNVSFVRDNIQNIANLSLGRFDAVFALCSLYYLPEPEIENIIAYLKNITDYLMLQCNISNSFSEPGRNLIAKPEYFMDLLNRCGYHDISLDAPSFYYRPVITARA